jgi:hypothetical protein
MAIDICRLGTVPILLHIFGISIARKHGAAVHVQHGVVSLRCIGYGYYGSMAIAPYYPYSLVTVICVAVDLFLFSSSAALSDICRLQCAVHHS